MAAAGDGKYAYPQYVKDRYLQLPATLPPRVRQLAEQVTGQSANPYDRAKAVEAYLRLLAPTHDIRAVPPGRDAVDFFLFEEKGYADYQASAMVVMLRASVRAAGGGLHRRRYAPWYLRRVPAA
ncbi:MAG: transglutaminase-like domain-containing protein [Dehalococcoidia bacterium]